MKKKISLLLIIPVFGISMLTACDNDSKDEATADKTVTEYAISDKNFSILVQALTKANLADVLNGAGNFTVFAPTNDAFNALFAQLGVSGIEDLSAATLTPILLYHVLGAEEKASMLTSGYYPTLSPAQGNFSSVYISTTAGVTVNKDAKVTLADVDVKNGVIHAIDKVLLPPTVVDAAIANGNFTILVQAVVKAGLAETLKGTGPFTVFAPTDAAFKALFTQLGVSGIADLSADQLVPILKYHVVSGNVRSSQLTAGNVTTLNGTISVTLSPAPAINGTSNIIATDVQASNGVIHVIDKVLLPR
jgi:transforming growth factor-beta-induced protein